MSVTNRPAYVIGDIHGYCDVLQRVLTAAGSATLWLLGDYVDRRPDGIGVIGLIMRLKGEAVAAGGRVEALLGNHDILLVSAHRFGDAELAPRGRPPRPVPAGRGHPVHERRHRERPVCGHHHRPPSPLCRLHL